MKKPKTTTDITNQLTKNIISYIEMHGGKAVRVNVVPVKGRRSTNIGFPDLDCMHNGNAFKVEVKKDEKDKLRESQEKFIDEWERAGGKVIVTWDIEHFINEFNKIKENQNEKSNH